MCKNPFTTSKYAFGCGQCVPCRINRRRIWSHRIMLESLKHSDNCFITLTYNQEKLPDGSTLDPRHTQLYIKRLRKIISPRTCRYYLCGEYGDATQRPHYHAAIFGLSPRHSEEISLAWEYGHSHVGDLTIHSAHYIAGYVTKKMTQKTDPRLNGRHPEFARMSLKPGIGALAVDDIASVLESNYGCDYLHENGDVPDSLRSGGKTMPLGSYLRRKLRERLSMPQEESSQKTLLQIEQEIQNVLEETKISAFGKKKSLLIKQALQLKNKQKILNLETKTKIFEKEKYL